MWSSRNGSPIIGIDVAVVLWTPTGHKFGSTNNIRGTRKLTVESLVEQKSWTVSAFRTTTKERPSEVKVNCLMVITGIPWNARHERSCRWQVGLRTSTVETGMTKFEYKSQSAYKKEGMRRLKSVTQTIETLTCIQNATEGTPRAPSLGLTPSTRKKGFNFSNTTAPSR